MINEIASFSATRKQIAATSKPSTSYAVKPWDQDIGSLLKQHKLEQIGQGMYASVYSTPSYPFVLKVFTSSDFRYLWWYHFMLKNQDNKYIPKIKGKLVKLNANSYAVRMEKLTTAGHSSAPAYSFLALVNGYVPATNSFSGIRPMWLEPIKEYFPNYNEDEDLKKICKFLASQPDSLDIHSGNLMKRGSQLVVTDPLATDFT